MRSQEVSGIHFLGESADVHEFALRNGKICRFMRIHIRQNPTGMCSHMERRRTHSTGWWFPILKDFDIVMTNGSPLFRHLDDFSLDKNQDGKYCGCEMLTTAI